MEIKKGTQILFILLIIIGLLIVSYRISPRECQVYPASECPDLVCSDCPECNCSDPFDEIQELIDQGKYAQGKLEMIK